MPYGAAVLESLAELHKLLGARRLALGGHLPARTFADACRHVLKRLDESLPTTLAERVALANARTLVEDAMREHAGSMDPSFAWSR